MGKTSYDGFLNIRWHLSQNIPDYKSMIFPSYEDYMKDSAVWYCLAKTASYKIPEETDCCEDIARCQKGIGP